MRLIIGGRVYEVESRFAGSFVVTWVAGEVDADADERDAIDAGARVTAALRKESDK